MISIATELHQNYQWLKNDFNIANHNLAEFLRFDILAFPEFQILFAKSDYCWKCFRNFDNRFVEFTYMYFIQ